jgi:hypothetical protein
VKRLVGRLVTGIGVLTVAALGYVWALELEERLGDRRWEQWSSREKAAGRPVPRRRGCDA